MPESVVNSIAPTMVSSLAMTMSQWVFANPNELGREASRPRRTQERSMPRSTRASTVAAMTGVSLPAARAESCSGSVSRLRLSIQ